VPMVLAFAVGLATVPLGRGRLSRLADLELRRWWLLVLAAVAQGAALGPVPSGAARALHLGSYLVAAAYLLSNAHLPGIWWVALGGGLNLLGIAFNGGTLPADPDALDAAGVPETFRSVNSAELADPALTFLGDIFPIPEVLPFSNVFSIGDVVIAVGVFICIHRLTGSRLVPAPSGTAIGLVNRPRLRTVAVAHALGQIGAWLTAGAVVLVTLGRQGALATAVALGLSGVCASLMMAGPLVDRFARPGLLACATFGQACAAALLLFWPRPSSAGVAAVITGFLAGLALPAAYALTADAVEPDRRTAALAGITGIGGLLGLLGAGLALPSLRALGPRPTLVGATLAFGLAALAWSITPGDRRRISRRTTLWRDLLAAVRSMEDSTLLARLGLLGAALGAGVGLAATDPFGVIGLTWRRATPLGLAAGCLAAGALIGALSATGRRRPWAALAPAMLLGGAGLFVGAAGGESLWARPGWVVGGIGVGLAGVLLFSLTLASAPPQLDGRLLSLVMAGQLVGLGTGYTVGGALLEAGGPVAAGAGAGIALLSGSVLAARVRAAAPPDDETSVTRASVAGHRVDHPEEVLATGEAAQVVGEEIEKTLVGLPDRRVGDMRSDEAVVEAPERVTFGEGLRVGDVEGGAAEPSLPQGVHQISGDHVASPGDVDEIAVGPEGVQLLSTDEALRLLGEGEADEGHQPAPQSVDQAVETHGPCRTCQWLGLSADDCCLNAEGSELLEQGRGDAAGADNGNPGAVEGTRAPTG
jgi:MFS family permease